MNPVEHSENTVNSVVTDLKMFPMRSLDTMSWNQTDLRSNQADLGMLIQTESSDTDFAQTDIETGLIQNLMPKMGNLSDWTETHLVGTDTGNQTGTG